MKLEYFLKLAVAGTLCLSITSSSSVAQPPGVSSKIQRLVENLAPTINVAVVDLRDGSTVYQHRADEKVKPASIMKTITSSVALSMLGPDYHFRTKFLIDPGTGKAGVIPTLYVKGGGDPSLTTEDMIMISRRIRRLGIRQIGRVVVDDSLFDIDKSRVGERAYEAGASATAFNFNTLGFDICPTEIGRPAQVLADPHELPISLMGKIITSGKRNAYYQINDESHTAGGISFSLKGEVKKSPHCQTIYRSIHDPATYLGGALIGFLSRGDIKVKQKTPILGFAPRNARILIDHASKPLSQIVWDLNHYSTNMIAEQLVYQVGFSRTDKLSHDTGLQRMGIYLERLGFPSTSFELYDGSGLSHSNRVTASIMASVLKDVYKNKVIWPEFESSLAVMGRSGTLRKRLRGLKGGVIRGKTGTLDNVSSLAAYVFSDTGYKYAFVSIANGSAVRRAKQFEEELAKLLLLGK
jgi:D-alanyl-D-alanine carboxypeptidase/D-alanyl-D-alanine-endopeptidase (penicillin-binding protein 4)